jgi:hypothetical protein
MGTGVVNVGAGGQLPHFFRKTNAVGTDALGCPAEQSLAILFMGSLRRAALDRTAEGCCRTWFVTIPKAHGRGARACIDLMYFDLM